MTSRFDDLKLFEREALSLKTLNHSAIPNYIDYKVEIPPQLILWAGKQKYQICGIGGAVNTEVEVQWLAHELSNWLGLSMIKSKG